MTRRWRHEKSVQALTGGGVWLNPNIDPHDAVRYHDDRRCMSKNITDVSKNISKAVGSGLPSSMQGRAGGTARAQMMKQMGGKEKSELAVMKGLRWLKDHQNEDGSWSDEFKPSMTGFAILCFLGHGETPE